MVTSLPVADYALAVSRAGEGLFMLRRGEHPSSNKVLIPEVSLDP